MVVEEVPDGLFAFWAVCSVLATLMHGVHSFKPYPKNKGCFKKTDMAVYLPNVKRTKRMLPCAVVWGKFVYIRTKPILA